MRNLTFGVVFHFLLQVIVDISNLVCGLNIASPSLHMGLVASRDPEFLHFVLPYKSL